MSVRLLIARVNCLEGHYPASLEIEGYLEVDNIAYDKQLLLLGRHLKCSLMKTNHNNSKELWRFYDSSFCSFNSSRTFFVEYLANGQRFIDNAGGKNFRLGDVLSAEKKCMTISDVYVDCIHRDTYNDAFYLYPQNPNVRIFVRKDLGFNKTLLVHYSCNKWMSFRTLEARKIEDGYCEMWQATFDFDELVYMEEVEFYVHLIVDGRMHYYDSNMGDNFKFKMINYRQKSAEYQILEKLYNESRDCSTKFYDRDVRSRDF